MARYTKLGNAQGESLHVFDDLMAVRVGAQQVGDSTLISIFKGLDSNLKPKGATFNMSDPDMLAELGTYLLNEASRIKAMKEA